MRGWWNSRISSPVATTDQRAAAIGRSPRGWAANSRLEARPITVAARDGARPDPGKATGMKARNAACAAALIATLVPSSCSSTSDRTTASATTTSSSSTKATDRARPSAVTPAGTKVGPSSDSELAALLVTTVPTGFTQQADDVGDTGPSDLAKAVRDDDTPGVADALRKEGFVRGYQRLWVGPNDAEIIMFVYQFGSATGAQADFDRNRPNVVRQAPPGSAPFPVDGLPAVGTAALAAMSEDGAAAVVLFTTGVYTVQVVCNAPSSAGLQERVSGIARDQYARL